MPKTPKSSANILFPGLPNYTGPVKGYFTVLHHEATIIEWSDDVMERIEYILHNKDANEVDIRLRHIVYLDPVLFSYDLINEAWRKKNIQALTGYLYANVHHCVWDGLELMFPKPEKIGNGNGYGYGYGYGNGNGNGYGYGDGDGY